MAQLRHDHAQFVARDIDVVVVGPEDARAFADYWQRESLPFVGLPDPRSSVLKLYGQQVNLFKLGRMPAQVLIDKAGVARFVHYGHSMSDIPENEEILALGDEINEQGDKHDERYWSWSEDVTSLGYRAGFLTLLVTTRRQETDDPLADPFATLPELTARGNELETLTLESGALAGVRRSWRCRPSTPRTSGPTRTTG